MARQINAYQDLEVWQLAVTLAEDSYRLVAKFPRDEIYGLTSQIRRSAVSIPANIAEGYGRDQTGSFIQFLRIAQGSARELETHLILAARLKLATEEQLVTPKTNCERVSKMLRALIRSLEERRSNTPIHD
jgi:four helix bundle protein